MTTATPSVRRKPCRATRVGGTAPDGARAFGRADGPAWVRGDGRASWVTCADAATGPRVAVFRLAFREPRQRTGLAPWTARLLPGHRCEGGPPRVPPNTTRRAIVDLQDYFCLCPRLTLRGGRQEFKL